MPVCLARFFPHDDVETGAVLIAEDETDIVVVCVTVDEKRTGEIHAAEGIVTCIDRTDRF